jgi:hypothetical protein
MFLHLLSDDERHAFAALAARMIQEDGVVVGREAAALAAMRAEMGIGEVRCGDRTVAELAAMFASRRSRVAALLELLGLGHSDTSFHLSERSLVTAVASEMGVGADQLAALEGWVQQHVEHVRRALVLMRE